MFGNGWLKCYNVLENGIRLHSCWMHAHWMSFEYVLENDLIHWIISEYASMLHFENLHDSRIYRHCDI